MRGSSLGTLGPGLALLLALIPSVGCNKKVKAQFERPPASASIPEPEAEDHGPPPEPVEPVEEVASEPTGPPAPKEEAPAAEPVRRPAQARGPEPAPPPPPPKPHLTRGQESADLATLRDKLARTSVLLAQVLDRPLSHEQREQVETAQAFIAQARKALERGDFLRAAVLGDKGFILAEDVERSSN